MTQEEIIQYAEGLSHASDAIYSEHDAEVLAGYNGCVDSNYSENFIEKIWKELNDKVYSRYDSYSPINVFAPNSIGAKLIKNAPKNSQIYNLSNEIISYLTCKATLQQMQLDWVPRVEYGCIANYFYFHFPIEDDVEVVSSDKYHIVFINYEKGGQYYKAIDRDNILTRLPY